MNTWIYMILIAALFALVAFMLYARFSSRSRGKLVHHSPGDISLESFDRDRPELGYPAFDDLSEDLFLEEDTLMLEDRKLNSSFDLSPIHAEPRKEEEEEAEEGLDEREEEEAYLDDLQEAAAGLALLMRSSPVQDRAAPVIFAPDEDSTVEDEAKSAPETSDLDVESTVVIPAIRPESQSDLENEGERDVISDSETLEPTTPVTRVKSSITIAEAEASSGTVADITDEDLTESETSHSSLLELLGDEVAGKFSLIDEDLDALEDLVAGVESRLSDWSRDDDSSVAPNSEVVTVEEAA